MIEMLTGVIEVTHVCIRHKRKCEITARAGDGSVTRVQHLDGTTAARKSCVTPSSSPGVSRRSFSGVSCETPPRFHPQLHDATGARHAGLVEAGRA